MGTPASILIVSKNRAEDLIITLEKIEKWTNREEVEVLVFLDGYCTDTKSLRQKFCWVLWVESAISIGASRARRVLFDRAKNELLFGFDDDANPLDPDFISKAEVIFKNYPNLGIIAFEELKGLFDQDELVRISSENRNKVPYFVREFIGCGYAISRSAYYKTRGFPEWVDIYGEEGCLSIEIIAAGYSIMRFPELLVWHRVNRTRRTNEGYDLFRFERQLKNTVLYYLMYYPFPVILIRLLHLLFHNFRKYALRDLNFCFAYFTALYKAGKNFKSFRHFRYPLSIKFIRKYEQTGR